MVLPDPTAHPAAPALLGLECQTRTPEEIVVVDPGGASCHRAQKIPDRARLVSEASVALRTALAGDCAWLWLLDRSVAPHASALERLLGALEQLRSLPPPVLLASKMLTVDGSLDPGSQPVPEVLRPDVAVAAVSQRLLALRVARRGSLLIHRRGFQTGGLPRLGSPRYDDLRWTARLLRRELGLLVPTSVAVIGAGGERSAPHRALELLGAIRLLGGDALGPAERPWFAFAAAQQARAGLRAGARALPRPTRRRRP